MASLLAESPLGLDLFRIYELRDFCGDLRDDGGLRRALHDLLHAPLPLLDDCDFAMTRSTGA